MEKYSSEIRLNVKDGWYVKKTKSKLIKTLCGSDIGNSLYITLTKSYDIQEWMHKKSLNKYERWKSNEKGKGRLLGGTMKQNMIVEMPLNSWEGIK